MVKKLSCLDRLRCAAGQRSRPRFCAEPGPAYGSADGQGHGGFLVRLLDLEWDGVVLDLDMDPQSRSPESAYLNHMKLWFHIAG